MIITLKSVKNKIRRHLLFVFFLSTCFFTSSAQTYTNGTLSTGATATGGTAAPAGFVWSELQGTNTSLGATANISSGITLADDFTIPAGVTWNITKLTFYAYSTGYTGATSPFNDTRIQIFNTNPSVGTPTPVFGNLTTNRFLASAATNIYRIGNAAPGTTRLVWKIEATVTASLAAGTYWIEWEHGTIAGVTSNFSPLKTVVGLATQPGNNALQHTIAGNTWAQLVDGTPAAAQDVPFLIDYTAVGSPCTATSPGNTISSATSVCPATNFTLSVQTPGSGLGLTYQWESSTDNVTYTAIAGAINTTYTTSQTVATWYRLKVTCGANAPLTSVPVQVTMSTNCYCIPSTVNCSLNDAITNVTFGGINNTTTCSSNGYGNFTSLASGNAIAGATNPIKVTVGPGGTEYVGVWIDYNQNGVFSTNEFTLLGSANGATISGNINIPDTALAGTTRMRVRVQYNTAVLATQSCTPSSGFGEVEDYAITIAPCVPVTIASGPSNASAACGSAASFSVTAAGSLITYQWQYRSNSSAAWVNVPASTPYSGVTSSTLSVNPVSTAINGYQYRVITSGACSALNPSAEATLTVTPIALAVSPANVNKCVADPAVLLSVPASATAVFSPVNGLYTNAAGTTPYVSGTAVSQVYAAPAATTTYSAVITSGSCSTLPQSIIINVNAIVGGTATLQNATICANGNATFALGGSLTGGPGFTHQFQVSTDNGITFTNVSNNSNYSGATTNTLTLTNIPVSFNGYKFRDSINTIGGCGQLKSAIATLTVNPTPVVTITASPIVNLYPGLTTTLSATVTPNAAASYQWIKDGVPVAGATASKLVVGVDGLGRYTVNVVDVNGCSNNSVSTPASIVVGDSVRAGTLFMYPSPNNGIFQVRFYNNQNDFQNAPATINVYDSRGSRVFTRNYSVTGVYQQLNVDLGKHGTGIYRVELTNSNGDRLKTGSVIVF